MIQLPQSIRWQIFVYYSALIATAIVLLGASHLVVISRELEQKAGLKMQAQLQGVFPFIFPPSRFNPGGPPTPPSKEEMDARLQNRQFREMIEMITSQNQFLIAVFHTGEIRYSSDNVPSDFQHPEDIGFPERLATQVVRSSLTVTSFSPRGDGVIMGVPLISVYEPLKGEVTGTILVGLAAFTVISLPGYWLIGRGLRPIHQISDAAKRISAGDLSERIDMTSQRSELGQLAGTLNQTFQRLQEALQRQVQFTADASHELRTPVAAILADCQFSLKKERPVERYLETIGVCQDSARHMSQLIERLGLLAKFDGQDTLLERESLDLRELAEQAAGVIEPLAHEQGLSFEMDLQPGLVLADRLRLGQAVINLLNNALRYNQPQGWIRLSTGEDRGKAFVEVEDSGVGIPADKIDKVFERFFRVDASRSKNTGGSGLGLAITKSIVEAHGGTIRVFSQHGRGSRFRIDLPAKN